MTEAQQVNVSLDELEQASINTLHAYLTDDKTTGSQAKVASTALSAVSRLKATAAAREATRYAVARDIAKNKDELKKYVTMSLPQLNPVKQLTG